LATTSIVLGILGMAISWLPIVGWIGLAMGLVACAIGMLSFSYWYEKKVYTGLGISGVFLGIMASCVSLSYQIKYATPSLDILYYPTSIVNTYLYSTVSVILIALGLFVTRYKKQNIGLVIVSVAIISLSFSLTSALLTTDREINKDFYENIKSTK